MATEVELKPVSEQSEYVLGMQVDKKTRPQKGKLWIAACPLTSRCILFCNVVMCNSKLITFKFLIRFETQ